MTKKKPVSVVVFAILNLVFGGLGLLAGFCGIGILAMSPTLQNAQPQKGRGEAIDMQGLEKHLKAKVPGYQAVQWGGAGLGLILSTVMIYSGIGLLRMNPAGRWAAIGYSVFTIFHQLAVVIYQIGLVAPVVDEWAKEQRVPLPSWAFIGLVVVIACIGILYAALLLLFMMLPGTAKAFAHQGEGGFGDTESDDYYDPGYKRERRDWPPEG